MAVGAPELGFGRQHVGIAGQAFRSRGVGAQQLRIQVSVSQVGLPSRLSQSQPYSLMRGRMIAFGKRQPVRVAVHLFPDPSSGT